MDFGSFIPVIVLVMHFLSMCQSSLSSSWEIQFSVYVRMFVD